MVKGEKVVVTGGAGFIGSNLARFLSKDNDVIIVDNLATGSRDNLKGFDADFVELDINNTEELAEVFQGCRYVFHQAAIPSVVRSVDDPMTSNNANITGTLSVFEAARKAGIEKTVFASSSSVYGDTPTLPKKEEMPTHPLSPYAVTKETCERYGRVFWSIYGMRNTGLRYFNVFGPSQNPNSQYSAVIPLFIRLAMENRPLKVYGDGEQSRDFTFVKDVIQANIKSAESIESDGKVLNIACGGRITINELISKIGSILGKETSVEYVLPRAGDIKHSLADISLAMSTTGFSPEFSIDDGLRETILWYKGNK